jgi:methionyl aminopeptidase
VEENLRVGMVTEEINTLVHEFTIKHGAIPAPLHYRGFPKSVCVSVNEEICHGIPGKRIVKDGDIVNVDVTPIVNGYYADASKTFFAGKPGPEAIKVVRVARESLKAGMAMVKPANRVGDIGWAIQTYAESEGCSVVREFVGHGVGLDFHEPPQIPHYGQMGRGIVLVPGMVFTVEPMINSGKKDLHILADNWTAVTDDGSLSAQFEQTLLVTEEGCESLTPYDLDA